MNRLRGKRYQNLPPKELQTKRKHDFVSDKSCGNPIMKMFEKISENYEGDEKTLIDKDGDEIVSSCRLLLVAHNSTGLDSWVVLYYLFKKITHLKIKKTARGLNL